MSGGGKSRKTRARLEKTDADILFIEPEDRSSYWYPFNISRMWKDEGPEDDSDSEDESGDEKRGNSQASSFVPIWHENNLFCSIK